MSGPRRRKWSGLVRIDRLTPLRRTARATTLDGAVQAFEAVIDNRITLRRELKTDVAEILAQLPDLDDLVLQVDESETANRFQSA